MKPKKLWKCKDCGKIYRGWSAWMNKHISKFEHFKFKRIEDVTD